MKDEIICGEPLCPRIVTALPLEDYKLSLTFTNGEQRIFDAKPLLTTGVFKSLQNKQLFESVKVAFGSLLWPNDIDYCPDTLYMESAPEVGATRFIPDDMLSGEDIADIKQARAEFSRGEGVRHEDIDWN